MSKKPPTVPRLPYRSTINVTSEARLRKQKKIPKAPGYAKMLRDLRLRLGLAEPAT